MGGNTSSHTQCSRGYFKSYFQKEGVNIVTKTLLKLGGHTNDLAELLGGLQVESGKIAGRSRTMSQCPFLNCV